MPEVRGEGQTSMMDGETPGLNAGGTFSPCQTSTIEVPSLLYYSSGACTTIGTGCPLFLDIAVVSIQGVFHLIATSTWELELYDLCVSVKRRVHRCSACGER